MKSFKQYLEESAATFDHPTVGDDFAINVREECLLETYVVEETDDGIVLHADEGMMSLLEHYGLLEAAKWRDPKYKDRLYTQEPDDSDQYHDIEYGYSIPLRPDNDPGQKRRMGGVGHEYRRNDPLSMYGGGFGRTGHQGRVSTRGPRKGLASRDHITSLKHSIRNAQGKHTEPNLPEEVVSEDYKNPVASAVLHRIMMQHPGVLATHGPERVMQAVDELADWVGDVDEIGSSDVSGWTRDVIRALAELPDEPMDVGDRLDELDMEEAKYQGREVPLGKPMAGDVKKSKVYVRGPKGNVVKVNFGDKTMKIKKSNPARRKSFRARHNCDNPGPRWKARYWSCRAW